MTHKLFWNWQTAPSKYQLQLIFPADKMIMEVWASAMSVSSIYAPSPNFPVMASGGEALHKMCRSHGQNHSSKDFLFTLTGQGQFSKSKHKYDFRPQMIWNYFAISCHLMSLSWCRKVCRAERKQWTLMKLELGVEERSQLTKPVGAHQTTTGTGALSTSAVTHSS